MHRLLIAATVLAVGLSTLQPALAASKTRFKPTTQQVKQLHKVVTAIALEAVESWKQEKGWPRKTPTFAQDHPSIQIEHDLLVHALSHRLHPHAAIDGYVKQQLLSFKLDPRKLSEDKPSIGRLVGGMPLIIAQPDDSRISQAARTGGSSTGGAAAYFFSGRQIAFVSDLTPIPGAAGFDPTLSVAQAGVVLEITDAAVQRNDRYITATLRAGNARLESLRTLIQRLNRGTIGYRNDLMKTIPQPGGLRVAAMLTDVEQRVRAAEPSRADAFASLADETRHLNDSGSASKAVRRRLAADARKLNKAYAIVLDRYAARSGQIVPIRSTVRLDQASLEHLLVALR